MVHQDLLPFPQTPLKEVSLHDELLARQAAAIARGADPIKIPRFNQTNDKIEWAKWTWNPVTGCLGPGGTPLVPKRCEYCYAWDIAEKIYPEGFQPTFREGRLAAPFHTSIPDKRRDEPGIYNVFVSSMGDLLGDWVPQHWIDEVLGSIRRVEKEQKRKVPKIYPWNFIILTKNAQRVPTIDWPSNVWVGITVDIQDRIQPAFHAFKGCNATVKFFSCEPLLEHLDFGMGLVNVDWVIIGGQSPTSRVRTFQPPWNFVERILNQARMCETKVYFKPNLNVRPKEYPSSVTQGKWQ